MNKSLFEWDKKMTKKYKTYTIRKSCFPSSWWHVFDGDEFIAYVPSEEEARRVIWLQEGRNDPITDEMMEIVK